MRSMRAPWAVVCDFDGTLLTEDLGDRVALRFAGERVYQEAEAAYRAGAYPFSALLSRIFAPITATREEIAVFARAAAELRPGFESFLEACRAADRPFLVVSAGLDAYIEPVLERLAPALRAHLEVRANRATCSPAGLEVAFHGDDCGFCGFCKGHVVKELQAGGHKVVVCGDGTGDRHAADAADFVFARRGSSLARYCRERGIAHRPFETFHEVMDAFPG
jgi:2-hydroxy-3-keto-5-methylthiopentenyl-1-phosphate phosphatase